MRSRGAAVAVFLVAALVAANTLVSDAQVSPNVIQAAIPKTVKLYLLDKAGKVLGGCSGSFVDPSGLILTAAHCVRDPKSGQLYNPEGLVAVGLNLPNKVNPVPLLIAERVVDNPGIDIALVRCVALLGEDKPKPLPPDLRFPFMSLRDSETIRIGEAVAVLGFPGVGGESITVVQGHVTGFDADQSDAKTWLKHDAAAAQGHSGGPVIDARGAEIAVVSHGQLNPHAPSESASHDALISRIPLTWHQYFGGPASAQPSRPPVSAQQPSRPAPQPPQTSAGVVLRGRIVDASSGTGIPGALFVIFRPGTSLQNPQQSDIIAAGQADGNGAFQTRPPVRKGATYPAAVLAQGYRQITGNLPPVPPDAPDVLDIDQPFQLQGQ